MELTSRYREAAAGFVDMLPRVFYSLDGIARREASEGALSETESAIDRLAEFGDSLIEEMSEVAPEDPGAKQRVGALIQAGTLLLDRLTVEETAAAEALGEIRIDVFEATAAASARLRERGEDELGEIASVLLGGVVAGGAATPTVTIDSRCQTVLDAAGERLVDLAVGVAAGPAAGPAAGRMVDGFNGLLDQLRLRELFEQAAGSLGGFIGRIRRWALKILNGVLEGVRALFGDEFVTVVKEKGSAIWNSITREIPGTLLGVVLGKHSVVETWAAETKGLPAGRLEEALVLSEACESDHLAHLKKAGRVTTGALLVLPWLSGVMPLLAFIAVAGIAGYILWAAWDHLADLTTIAVNA